MKKINWVAIGINIVLFLLSNLLILMKVIDRKNYDFGANVLVMFCLFLSIYTQLNPEKIKWFENQLEGTHTASMTISRIFGLILLVPAFFMNIHPYIAFIK